MLWHCLLFAIAVGAGGDLLSHDDECAQDDSTWAWPEMSGMGNVRDSQVLKRLVPKVVQLCFLAL